MKNNKASNPNTIVESNCPMLPIKVMNTPFKGCNCLRINTLPKYSPMRLGVKTLTVTPEKTALNDWKNEICSNFPIRYFHFCASRPQLTNISKKI